jgi:hypothetical protein
MVRATDVGGGVDHVGVKREPSPPLPREKSNIMTEENKYRWTERMIFEAN